MERNESTVLRLLIDHNPNGMRVEHLRPLMGGVSDDEILRGADGLQQRGLITITEHPNQFVPGRVLRTFTLTDTSRYPIRETIRVGEIEFPRFFQGDVVGAEDVNGLTQAIQRYNETLDAQVRTLSQDLLRRYWGNTAVLLGLFVAVFALIVKGATVTTAAGGSTIHLMLRNFATLAPLAVVLLGFVALLSWIVRRL